MNRRPRRCFIRMLLFSASAFAAFLPGFGAALTASGTVTLSGFNFSNGTIPVPQWSNGAVVAIEGQTTLAPTLHIFDVHGNYLRTVPFTLDGATWLVVRGYSSGPDGTIALCGEAKDAQAQVEHFVAILPPDQLTRPKIVRTYPYSPAAVAIAPDGTIWTMGIEYEPVPGKMLGRVIRPQAKVIRHFDHEGNQIGGFIPQASVAPPDLPRPALNGGSTNLAASGDRVGWYQGWGKSYFEIAADGTVQSYPALAHGSGEDIIGLALTTSGHVFVSKLGGGRVQSYELDRTHGTWQPVQFAAPGATPLGPVLGAAGNAVAVAVSGGGMSIEFFPSH